MRQIEQLIGRVLGESYISRFTIILEDKQTQTDYFELQTIGEKIEVRASSPLAAASGVYWYLKHYLNMQLSWCGNQDHIPEVWPVIEKKIYKHTPYTYKYYLNYCTYGYSMAFWEWDRWEQELDWMAMNGINLVLSLVGHEEVWRQTLIELGYTNDEAKSFICGPAFLPWQWMQNIEGWGSGYTDTWFEKRVALAKKIHKRMKELGITPAMQGYSGMIPKNFKQKYKEIKTLDQGLWCNLPRPDLLIPGTDKFDEVADIFYQKQKEIFKVDTHFYCTDPFHEGGNRQGLEVGTCIKIIQDKMLEHDLHAIWVIQAWGENPDDITLGALNPKHSLILDLWCEANPTWRKRTAFRGIPWIWCILGNFGGKNGLYGNLKTTATGHLDAHRSLESGQMLGIGLTMEGIDNNPIVWDLLCDSSWEKEIINLDKWLEDYLLRRYGKRTQNTYQAWQLLKESIYNCTQRQEGGVESIICARPRLQIDSVSTWGPKTYYYDIKEMAKACKLLLSDYNKLHKSSAYLYDLVDVTRQALADLAKEIYLKMTRAFYEKDKEIFKLVSTQFLELIEDMDRLLGTHSDFLLGKYLEKAKSLGSSADESIYLEWNARTLITLWANKEGSASLRDYSHRQWAGLTKDFYYRRWELYIHELIVSLEENQEVIGIDWYSIEYEWTIQTDAYCTEVKGDTQTIINEIVEKYLS